MCDIEWVSEGICDSFGTFHIQMKRILMSIASTMGTRLEKKVYLSRNTQFFFYRETKFFSRFPWQNYVYHLKYNIFQQNSVMQRNGRCFSFDKHYSLI